MAGNVFCWPGRGIFYKIYLYLFFVFFLSESGFICMKFYERDNHVIEIQQSREFCLPCTELNWCILLATKIINPLLFHPADKYTTVPEEACNPDFFDSKSLPYVTLLSKFCKKCKYVIA